MYLESNPQVMSEKVFSVFMNSVDIEWEIGY